MVIFKEKKIKNSVFHNQLSNTSLPFGMAI